MNLFLYNYLQQAAPGLIKTLKWSGNGQAFMYERDQMREGGKIRLMNGIKIQLDSLSLPAKRPPRRPSVVLLCVSQ